MISLSEILEQESLIYRDRKQTSGLPLLEVWEDLIGETI